MPSGRLSPVLLLVLAGCQGFNLVPTEVSAPGTLRAIENQPPRLECMGIEPGIFRAYRPRNGIVLICGATGTGKTRLQAGMTCSLIEAPRFHGKIIEVAWPIEYEFDAIAGASSIYSPSEIGRHVKSASAAMRDALRRKPKVIVSPECRDRETMEVAIEGSQTGHAVYSTVHTSSVVETVHRILHMFPQEERADRAVSLMQALRLIVNCALVPSTDGRRTQLREYLAFGPAERDLFLDAPMTTWPGLNGVPPAVLLMLLQVEGGRLGEVNGNRNGTVDIGPFQVNEIWLPAVARHWGMTVDQAFPILRDNFCGNADAAAWGHRQLGCWPACEMRLSRGRRAG